MLHVPSMEGLGRISKYGRCSFDECNTYQGLPLCHAKDVFRRTVDLYGPLVREVVPRFSEPLACGQ